MNDVTLRFVADGGQAVKVSEGVSTAVTGVGEAAEKTSTTTKAAFESIATNIGKAGTAAKTTADEVVTSNERMVQSSRAAGEEMATVGSKAEKAGKSFAGSTSSLLKMTAGFAGIALGAHLFSDALNGAEAFESSQKLLQQTMANMGISWKNNSGEVNTYIGHLSDLAGFTKVQLVQSMTSFLRITGDVTKAQRDESIAADLARAKHISLEAATKILVRAQEGNVASLSRYGIIVPKVTTNMDALKAAHDKAAAAAAAHGEKIGPLTDAQKREAAAADKTATAEKALALVHSQTRDAAEKATTGTEHLQATLANLTQEAGTHLVPVINAVADGVVKWADGWNKAGTSANAVKGDLTAVAGIIKTVAEDANGLAKSVGGWVPVLEAVGGAWAGLKIYGWAKDITGFTTTAAQKFGLMATAAEQSAAKQQAAAAEMVAAAEESGVGAEAAAAEVEAADAAMATATEASAVAMDAAISSTGFGALAIAAGLAATYIITHWGQVKKWFGDFVGWFANNWKTLVDIGAIFIGPVALIITNWGKVKSWFEKFAKDFAELFTHPIAAVKNMFGDLETAVEGIFSDIVRTLAKILASIPGSLFGVHIPGAHELHDWGKAHEDWGQAGTDLGTTLTTNLNDALAKGFAVAAQNAGAAAAGIAASAGEAGAGGARGASLAAQGKGAGAVDKAGLAHGAASASVTTATSAYASVPYVWGGGHGAAAGTSAGTTGDAADPNAPNQNGLDCSGYARAVLAKLGVSVSGTAADMYNAAKSHPSTADLQAGDLVFYEGGAGDPNHVMVYIGGGMVEGETHTGAGVQTVAVDYQPITGTGRYESAAAIKASGGTAAPTNITTTTTTTPTWDTKPGKSGSKASPTASAASSIASDVHDINDDISKKLLGSDVANELKKNADRIQAEIKAGTKADLPTIKKNLTDLHDAIQQGLKQAADDKILKADITTLKSDIKNGLVDKSLGDSLLAQAKALDMKLADGLLKPGDFASVETKAKALKVKLAELLKQATDATQVKKDIADLNADVANGILPPSIADPLISQLKKIDAKLQGSILSDAERKKLEIRAKAIETVVKSTVTEMKAQEAIVTQDISTLTTSITDALATVTAASIIPPASITAAAASVASLNKALLSGTLTPKQVAAAKASIQAYENTIQSGIQQLEANIQADQQAVSKAWTDFGNLVDQTFQNDVTNKISNDMDQLSADFNTKELAAKLTSDQAALATAIGSSSGSPIAKAMQAQISLWQQYEAARAADNVAAAEALQNQIVTGEQQIAALVAADPTGQAIVDSGNAIIGDLQQQGDANVATVEKTWADVSAAQQQAIDKAISDAQTAVNNGEPITEALKGLRQVFIDNGLSPADADGILADPITGALTTAVNALNQAVIDFTTLLKAMAKVLGIVLPDPTAALATSTGINAKTITANMKAITDAVGAAPAGTGNSGSAAGESITSHISPGPAPAETTDAFGNPPGSVTTGTHVTPPAGASPAPPAPVQATGPVTGQTNSGASGTGACFTGDTPVATPRGPVPIAKIDVGDYVFTRDMSTGRSVVEKVTEVQRHEGDEGCQVLVLTTDSTIVRVTPEHLLHGEGGWRCADEFQVGDLIDTEWGTTKVVSVTPLSSSRFPVYNLHVDHPDHNYFAGGLLAHNVKPVFATGGVTPGRLGAIVSRMYGGDGGGVVPGLRGPIDNQVVRASSAEMMLTTNMQQRLLNWLGGQGFPPGMLAGIANGSGSSAAASNPAYQKMLARIDALTKAIAAAPRNVTVEGHAHFQGDPAPTPVPYAVHLTHKIASSLVQPSGPLATASDGGGHIAHPGPVIGGRLDLGAA